MGNVLTLQGQYNNITCKKNIAEKRGDSFLLESVTSTCTDKDINIIISVKGWYVCVY